MCIVGFRGRSIVARSQIFEVGRSRNSDFGSKESNRSKSWQNDFPKEKKLSDC